MGERSEGLTDVAFAVVCNDDLCKALVDGHVLLERCALVKELCLWCVWDCIVETGPEDLKDDG